MKTSTITLTISHEGDLPKGLLAAIEAKAYDWTMARGVACGEVVAETFQQDGEWKLVPVEPTEAMLKPPEGMALDQTMAPLWRRGRVLTWKDMLASAPAATSICLPVKEMRDE